MIILKYQGEGNALPEFLMLLDAMCFIVSLEIGMSVYHYFVTIISVFSWHFPFQMTQELITY